MEEYLRRNNNLAKSIGVCAGAAKALDRLAELKRQPKWIVKAFEDIHHRASALPDELAAYRNIAPDAPKP